MKKNIVILLAVVAVLAIAYLVINRGPWGNFRSELKDFAIKDTGAITKMFFADKSGNSVQLSKNESGEWMVNDLYRADIQKINLMKETMHDIEIRNPLSEAEFNNVVTQMSAHAIKAEFYEGDRLVKAVYVGSATPDHTGTFMMVEGSSAPFVIHIQGFVGYLTPRFNTVPYKWRDKLVFNYSMQDIANVSVTYPGDPAQSFRIDNRGATPQVFYQGTNKPVQAAPNFISYYLSSFGNLYYEGFDEDIPQAQADSIHHLQPYCVISLTTRSGLQKKLQVNLKPVDRRTMMQYDEQGNQLETDTEKYLAFVDDGKEMVYIQHYNFGRLFKKVADFEASARAR